VDIRKNKNIDVKNLEKLFCLHKVFYQMSFYYIIVQSQVKSIIRSFENYARVYLLIEDVVNKYLDYGNPKNGFARIKCKDCGLERLLIFSCHGRGFCPSCHAKRREEWGEWMREKLVLDVPHRQVVFTVPKMLRIYFKYNRSLLSDLCLCGKEALLCDH